MILKNLLLKGIIALGNLFIVGGVLANETAPGITDLTKRFDQYSWVTAHNGYLDDMKKQLDRGVRGFMLDLHPGNLNGSAGVYLCHTTATGKCDVRTDMKLSDALNNVFLPFLRNNPNAVVSLLFETYVSRANLAADLARVPGLASWVYQPTAGEANWPTLKQMIVSNKRLLMFTDDQAGMYQVNNQSLELLKDSTWATQNYWDLGVSSLKHDWSCPSRWYGSYSQQVSAGGFNGWNRLFVMNQFHAWGASAAHVGNVDNNLTRLEHRVNYYCKNAIGFRKAPNYLAVDFNQAGDVFPYAAALTQGGFYFYEGNNAASSKDTVCVIPAGRDYDFKLPSRGCENDEIRSLKLRGIPKGTRITLFDSLAGSGESDSVTIDVKKTIGLDEEDAVIGSLERSFETAQVKVVSVRNNGLDGKVSRIKIERMPTDFSDSVIVFYEGNGGRGNIVCSVNVSTTHARNFTGACDNDEARSAKILKAKAGTRFTVYGNWNQHTNQGYAQIEVLRDITSPVIVGSFEKNYVGHLWKITRSAKGKTLDGKVSSLRVVSP